MRDLTAGEIRLAKAIFGDTINYSKVEIKQRKFVMLIPVPRFRAFAPNGNIYFHPNNTDYREDFSKARIELKSLFLHEMTHVWQAQNNPFFALKEIRKKHRTYKYKLSENTDFNKDLGVEQQAQVVGDAFKAANKVERITQDYPPGLYLRILRVYFPVKTDVNVEIIDWEPLKEGDEEDENENPEE